MQRLVRLVRWLFSPSVGGHRTMREVQGELDSLRRLHQENQATIQSLDQLCQERQTDIERLTMEVRRLRAAVNDRARHTPPPPSGR
jgi:hypothetical protein